LSRSGRARGRRKRRRTSRHAASAAGRGNLLPFGEGSRADGTLGAVRRARFRERARMTALEGTQGASQAFRARSFERGPLPQGRHATSSSTRSEARCRDMGCPSLSGWGKSAPASGRRGGGRRGDKSQVTPGLRKLGWRQTERDVAIRQRVVRHSACRRSDGALACSGNGLLQKLAGGMWPLGPGEQPVSSWV
jgi:hypothetical protein